MGDAAKVEVISPGSKGGQGRKEGNISNERRSDTPGTRGSGCTSGADSETR